MRRSAPWLLFVFAVACNDAPALVSYPDVPPPDASLGPCRPPPRGGAGFVLAPALGDARFAQPVELIFGPEGRAYVVEQVGTLRVVPPGGAPALALDLRERVLAGGELGLLGLAFDPDFATNGWAYVFYTRKIEPRPDVVTQEVVARFTSDDGGLTFDPASEKELFALDDPYTNHNGGKIAFGPDRMLYVAIGDGGSGGDPLDHGQNTNVLFGKILRIDPHGGDPYGIPADNPFAGGGGRGEVWAYGLRNPWRFSFDRVGGNLRVADVGQNKYEEIDLVTRGGNYGWKTREGRHCFEAETCETAGLVDPVIEYGREEGTTVVAGYVYRGAKIPSLVGRLVYGDFGNGNIWSGTAFGQDSVQLLLASDINPSTFGQDDAGEVYVADYTSGAIFELAEAPPGQVASGEGTSLAATGCFDVATGAAPPGAIAYSVNSPLWSDGAAKDRWVFVPPDAKIGVGADGDFDLPVGSTAVKTFLVGGKRIETRLFTRYASGWAGFSYEWNDAGTDATLLESQKTKALPDGESWYFPSRSDCFACHTPAAGFSLGLEARQLHRTEGERDVLAAFAPHLAAPIAPESFPPLAAADSPDRSAAERARGYLHANCSMCHRPGGGAGRAAMDLRVDRADLDTGACDAEPNAGDLGVAGARLIAPGEPERSLLPRRMRATDGLRMPPLASRVVDVTGASAVEAWIRDGACR